MKTSRSTRSSQRSQRKEKFLCVLCGLCVDRLLLSARGVEAEATAAVSGDVEECEAEHDGELSAVLDRQSTTRRVRDEVRRRHLAARDERGPRREEADQDERAEDRLEHPCNAEQRCQRH